MLVLYCATEFVLFCSVLTLAVIMNSIVPLFPVSRYCSSKSSLPKSDSDPDLFASDVEMNSLATGNNPFSSKENFSTSQVNNSLQCK